MPDVFLMSPARTTSLSKSIQTPSLLFALRPKISPVHVVGGRLADRETHSFEMLPSLRYSILFCLNSITNGRKTFRDASMEDLIC